MKRSLVFSTHSVNRMFKRGISVDDVAWVVDHGETVEEYPDDTPYPSRLVLGWPHDRPIHVVVAENAVDSELVIVTVYEPDSTRWDSDFRRRLL